MRSAILSLIVLLLSAFASFDHNGRGKFALNISGLPVITNDKSDEYVKDSNRLFIEDSKIIFRRRF